MSVIIKDMEMPRACWCCGGCDGDNNIGYFCALTPEGKDIDEIDIHYGKPSWCPLIEIPTPHGRLIDADKIEYHFEVNENTAMEGCEIVTKGEISRVPTVLGKEE